MSFPKNVFISYADADREHAKQLRAILEAELVDQVWCRDFELDGGEDVSHALAEAIDGATWFILLMSENSTNCRLMNREARYWRAVFDKSQVKVIVVRLDQSPYPKHLRLDLEDADYILDHSEDEDLNDEYSKIADRIRRDEISRARSSIYVNRGGDADRFEVEALRNRVIFILGIAGIGKTEFVRSDENGVVRKLRKRATEVRLTTMPTIDYVAREILRVSHAFQPVNSRDEDGNEHDLIASSLDTLDQKSGKRFLFLDDAENALDALNQLLPEIDAFIAAFLRRNIRTHIILATTRVPHFSAEIAGEVGVFRLDGLDEIHIEQCFYKILSGHRNREELMNDAAMRRLIERTKGYPLAAGMLASALQGNSRPDQIIRTSEIRRYERRWAEYILQSVVQENLSDLEELLVQVLALADDALSMEDLLAIKDVAQYSPESIDESILNLSKYLLIETERLENGVELYRLHGFVASYYREELGNRELISLRTRIIDDIAIHAYRNALQRSQELKPYVDEDLQESRDASLLSGEMFRYAVIADSFLRMAGEDGLAEELPVQIKGTMRRLVYVFYQDMKDYRKTIEYADKWLQIQPTDRDVMLYKARCYRQHGETFDLDQAEAIISELEKVAVTPYLKDRVISERAIIAEMKGDRELAKQLCEGAIARGSSYPRIHVDLATYYLADAEAWPAGSQSKLKIAHRALQILENIRESSRSKFDKHNFDVYVDALLAVGEDGARGKIVDALLEHPTNPRLTHKMAEILHNEGDFYHAEKYARTSIKVGNEAARLTLANILYGQALSLQSQGMETEGNDLLRKALNETRNYRTQVGVFSAQSQEVLGTINAKIYRALGDWQRARDSVSEFTDTKDRFTVYEQAVIELHFVDENVAAHRYEDALAQLHNIAGRINQYPGELTPQLTQVLHLAIEKRAVVQNLIQNER